MNTTFPLLQSAVAISNAVIGPDTAAQNGGATLTVVDPSTQTYEIKIPGLNIDANVRLNQALGSTVTATPLADGRSISVPVVNPGLSYTTLGFWQVKDAGGALTNLSPFATGYRTVTMPSSGAAGYGGATATNTMVGYVYAPNSNSPTGYSIMQMQTGIQLSVNFDLNRMAGQNVGGITYTSVFGPAVTIPWQQITFDSQDGNSKISGGGAFQLLMLVGPSVQNCMHCATGTLAGFFFGPNAAEIGGVFTISDVAGVKANGVFGAAKAAPAPSDRRLKRDIEPIASAPSGLRLYRYRYEGDERLFTGVMAQDLLDDPRLRHAVDVRPSGVMIVDYGAIGFIPSDLEAMQAAGFAAVAAYETRLTA